VTIRTVLEASDLHCERSGRTLFRGLSFALKKGEALRIAGANGRGKTSLLRILCGLLAPTAGEVRWDGSPIGSLKEEFSKNLVYLGHAQGLKDELSAFENLMVTWIVAGRGMPVPADSLMEALSKLDVPMTLPVKKLSQGQRRRAALARLALSRDVPLWLLDEPLAALDEPAARLVEGLIMEHIRHGGSVVYTTHQEARLQGRVVDLDA
jgi:heme exporter protein A